MRGPRILRWLRRALVCIGLFAIACAAPILYVETQCEASGPLTRPAASAYDIPEKNYRRAEGDSFLSYPEWYIVHAYTDLAGVTRLSSESRYDYIEGISGFWTSLCRATQAAGAAGPVTLDQKTTNYIIGISFTLEFGLIGFYERTIGALSAAARGPARTAEDEFALKLADDYAAFLQQTPWYEFPFWPRLAQFWRDTPFDAAAAPRSIERRFALTLQYGAKALYAKLLGTLAGYSPADLTLMSVVGGLDAADIAAEQRIKPLRDVRAGATLIETPRYQAFTEILRSLGARGRAMIEISGNRHILTTVVVPDSVKLNLPGAVEIFALPVQSQPGWRRIGLDTEVAHVAAQIGAVEKQGGRFEHAYDY